MSSNLGNITAYACVPLTLGVGYRLVLPQLTGWVKAYYVFLLAWAAPYVVGNVCDNQKVGPIWAQWHLLDVSYVQWSITLGVTLYAMAMKFSGRAYNQRSILIASAVSLTAFVVLAYGWEFVQSWHAWKHFHQTIDWSDYFYYAVGTAFSLPFFALRRAQAAVFTRMG